MEPQLDANPGDSSTAQQTQAPEQGAAASSPANTNASESGAQTLADVVNAAASASLAQGSNENGSGTKSVPDGNKEAQTEVGAKEEPATEVEGQVQDPDGSLPFAEHPRWKEVYGKMKTAERDVEQLRGQEAQWKPFVEAQQATNDFCTRNRITVEQFRDILDVQALINNDPKAAHARLKPLMERLSALAGQASTFDPDIADAIRTGKIDETWAQQIQAGRAQQAFASNRVQMTQHDQARFVAESNSEAVAQWARDMAQRDTAFKPTANGKKGVFELTTTFLGELCRQNPPRSPVEATRLAQQAYDEAKSFITPTAPARAATTVKKLPPNGSSAHTKTMPKSLSDVVRGVANGTLKPGFTEAAA